MDTYEIHANYKRDGSLAYRFIDFANGVSVPAGETSPQSWENTRLFVNKSFFPAIRIAGKTSYLSNGEITTALKNLAGFGRQLYREFVPHSLREIVHNLEDGSTLKIVSDEFEIPWELVYNGKDFWGRRFVISRCSTTYDIPPQELKKPKYSKILNIVGATMSPNVKYQALHLFDSLKDYIEVVVIDGDQIQNAHEIHDEFNGADLIHFTCHGEQHESGLYLQIVNNEIPFLNFMPTAISGLDIKPGCIIFANACVSAGFQTGINTLLSFGTEFCSNEKKGGAFIGTLDYVPDYPAVAFAETFYKFLFEGCFVGEALCFAKRSQLSSEEGTRFGMFPLVYSLYGNPYV